MISGPDFVIFEGHDPFKNNEILSLVLISSENFLCMDKLSVPSPSSCLHPSNQRCQWEMNIFFQCKYVFKIYMQYHLYVRNKIKKIHIWKCCCLFSMFWYFWMSRQRTRWLRSLTFKNWFKIILEIDNWKHLIVTIWSFCHWSETAGLLSSSTQK